MARLLMLDVSRNELRETECNELQDFYRDLGAEIFDITRRKIGGKMYDIFVDDMGMFRENPIVSAISRDGKPMLVGNLIFANHNEAGETTDITMQDIARIMSKTVRVHTVDNDETHLAVMCEY